jgi:O-antigen/teichoic acid export membrane protein
LSGFQNAIVNSPMTVLLPRISSSEKNSFVSSLFVGQAILLLLIGGICVPFFPPILELTLNVRTTILVGLVFFLCVLAFLSRDFARGYFYVILQPVRALLLDSSYAVALVLLLTAFALSGLLSAQWGIVAIGISAAVGCSVVAKTILGILDSRFDFRTTLMRTWPYSKWAVLGVFASWFQTNTFIYLAGLTTGVGSVAQVGAARLFMVPASLLVAGWGTYIRPVMSEAVKNQGKANLLSLIRMGTITLAIVILLYTVTLYILFGWISPYVLPSAYREIGGYLVLWGCIAIVDVFGSNMSNGMQSLLLFRKLSYVGVVAMVVSIGLGSVSARYLGSIGFLLGVVFSNIVLALLCFFAIRGHSD